MAYPIQKKSIAALLQDVASNSLILPALQRDFVWKPKDICKLFDSLMQGYPINTMMFWKTNNIQNQPISFYQFLPANHIEGTNNPLFNTTAIAPQATFHIVIDGQQRITSLWIGLTGSYKTVRAKTASSLYVRVDTPNTNPDLKFDFQFLTPTKLNSNQKKGEVWFKVSNIMVPSFNIIATLKGLNLLDNEYAQTTLYILHLLVSDQNVINFYEIDNNNIDDVLEIFIRTNSGGYVLKKGDLLMSALTVSWASLPSSPDARNYVEDIIDMVDKKCYYKVDKDWVFNVFLMVSGSPLGLKPSAFMTHSVPLTIHNNAQKIKDSIEKAFELISAYHLLEKGLTTKLAVIPIVYYIFNFNLQKTAILSTNNQSGVFSDVRKFLFRAIVKNLFEASTDETLKNIRDIINVSANKSYFPYKEIEQQYSELQVSANDIDDLLATRKSNAFPILNIIYALGHDMNPCIMQPNASRDYDVDHMHPKATFDSKVLSVIHFTTPQDAVAANDGVTFDTVVNLELLEDADNRSKNKKHLVQWLSIVSPAQRITLPQQHFFNQLPIDIVDFGTFVDKRKKLLSKALTYL